MIMKTWVVQEINYDYYRFVEVLHAGSPTSVQKWLKKNNTENLPVVFPKQELPRNVTHYSSGAKREEPTSHILIEEF